MQDLTALLSRCNARMPKTGAERQAEYRARKEGAGEKVSRGKSGRSKSKWEAAQFIALDGEGENFGPRERFQVGKNGKVYYAQEHRYTLLAASSGESLYNGGKRLKTMDCLNFLLDLSDDYPKAVFVFFAGSYDINHMLMHGFARAELQKIARGETYQFEHEGEKFLIEYRARKSLSLKRGLSYRDSRSGLKPYWKSTVTIWDVFGFFQENFVGVMRKWLGESWHHFALISDMKKRRGDFANVPQQQINDYNQAELESLVALMQKVRGAIDGLNLKCARWDGAGAVAAGMFKKHGVRDFKERIYDRVIVAARTAYAGGRIEVCKIGTHNGPVYDYDINSAYPTMMHDMPCLAHGVWISGECQRGKLPPRGFTLVECEFEFMEGLPFYPLFFRTEQMQILFPRVGRGWYWWPEYEAAQQCPGNLKPLRWFHWKQKCDHKPFDWIPEYYATRQQWVKAPLEDWHGGGEKIIKLGLNSLYGKTAQQLGGTEENPPAYHQIEWAGYITSATRARLYLAALKNPEAIIGFATDGIFSTAPLDIPLSRKKEFGAWELKEPVPDGMTIAQAGVYWWHYADGSFTHYSRGFDKESMRTPDKILAGWKNGKEKLNISMHRLIGMGTACTSDTLWAMRGRFTEGKRTLRLDGESNKREGIDVKKTKPHLKLVALKPKWNKPYATGAQEISLPYPPKWDENADDPEYKNDLELARENSDTENI